MSKVLELAALSVVPTIDPQDGGFDTFLNYVCIRDPTADEPLLPYHDYPWLPFWWQTANSTDSWATYTTSDFWLCVDNAPAAMVWWRMVFDSNITSVLNSVGWEINTSRSYSARTSAAFGTSYTPSASNDTQVIASVKLSSTVLLASTVDIQVDTGSGFTTILELSVSGLAATMTQSATFIVPAGASYKLVQSVGGSSIIYINELSL